MNHISCSWECRRVWGNEPSQSQVTSHFGSWSLDGFLNLQKMISGIKNHWIEEFLISLKRSWNLNGWNGFAWPIWVIKTQVMAKRRARSQFDSRPLKVKNRPVFLTYRWHATYHWKDLDKGYKFSSNLTLIRGFHTKLCASKIIGVPILGFRDSHLGVLKQNDIWVLALWACT